MHQHIVLVGGLAVGIQSILEERITVPTSFDTVRVDADEDRVREALADADVVVGDWPSEADADAAPHLSLMQRTGAGVDTLDRDRIPPEAYVCNVYTHGSAIAEHVFALLLALRRRLLEFDEGIRNGEWEYPRPTEGSVRDIRGSTLGIVGFGHIGRALVPRARGFELDVIAIRGSDPTGDSLEGVRFLGGPDDIDRILTESDVVVVAVPLNDATSGLISERELELMGDDAVLINVARGPVVEEQALYEALSREEIGGAGIDTWYRYPIGDETVHPSNYPFGELDNVVLTPHVAGWSDQTAEARYDFIAENITRVAQRNEPKNIVWEPRA